MRLVEDSVIEEFHELKRRERRYRQELRIARDWFRVMTRPNASMTWNGKLVPVLQIESLVTRIDKALKPKRGKK